MPEVVVRDVALWTKHIHGDARLRDELSRLESGREIELLVDGVKGYWQKMADGRDGRPTMGLMPRGKMQDFWKELYLSKRGEAVSIARPERRPPEGHRGMGGGDDGSSSPVANDQDRGLVRRSRDAVEAARAAFLSPRGWSSEGRTLTRDELHDR